MSETIHLNFQLVTLLGIHLMLIRNAHVEEHQQQVNDDSILSHLKATLALDGAISFRLKSVRKAAGQSAQSEVSQNGTRKRFSASDCDVTDPIRLVSVTSPTWNLLQIPIEDQRDLELISLRLHFLPKAGTSLSKLSQKREPNLHLLGTELEFVDFRPPVFLESRKSWPVGDLLREIICDGTPA